MKNKVVLFVIGYAMLIFSSCLNSDEDVEYITVRDPQIASFSLANDSIPGLSSVKFVIDQVSNPAMIYNRDSLPYGTDKIIEEKGLKMVATVTFTSGVSEIEIVPQATRDTIYLRGENDSIDFSQPVDIKTTAYDGITTKRYLAKLNIHQVNPDTMLWKKYAEDVFPQTPSGLKALTFPYNGQTHTFIYSNNGAYTLQIVKLPPSAALTVVDTKPLTFPSDVNLDQLTRFGNLLVVPGVNGDLYQSEDGYNWTPVAGLQYPVKYVLGEVKPQDNDVNDPVLSVIVEYNGLHFAALTEDLQFVLKEDGQLLLGNVPQGVNGDESFSVEGFGSVNYSAGYYNNLLLVAGKDAAGNPLSNSWRTTNGIVWSKQSEKEYFKPKSGVVVAHYDNKIYMLGGLVEGSTQSNDIYCSPNRGVSWALADSTIVLPDEFVARGYSSVIVDDENFMFIFGGKGQETDTKMLNEIWRGRINRLGFEIQ